MKAVALLLVACSYIGISNSLTCNDDKIRGVNLGGWLLLEPWITPVIFQEVNIGANEGLIVDEYTYAQYLDPAQVAERLDRHWDTFFSQEELQLLFDSGISHLRIPIPYWIVDVSEDEPFPPPPASDDDGMRFYLKRLVGWAEEIGLKVLFDLHGAPGSQNGFDNSGRRGDIHWFDPNDHSNIDRTLVILDRLTEIAMTWIDEGHMSADTFYGIELVNEPGGWWEELWEEVRDHFNYEGYDTVRARMADFQRNHVVIQDAFRAGSEYYGYMSEEEGYQGVALDKHLYHAFGDYWNELAETPEGWGVNLETSCDYKNEVEGHTLDTFTGEWSLAVTDCQLYLDGGYMDPYVPVAKPETCVYYNSDFSTFEPEYMTFLNQFAMAQMDGFEIGKGWFFWTAKTENICAPEWDYLFLLQAGVMPANLCERPNYCEYAKK